MRSRKFSGGGKRGRTVQAVLALLLAVSSAFASRSASAESGSPRTAPIRIAYEGGPGCPSREAFLQELHKRTVDAVFVAASADSARFTAEAKEMTDGARGWLRVQAPGTGATTREVSGSSCAEVVSALALVTVLSIRPKTSDSPRVDSGPPAASVVPAPPVSNPAGPARPAPRSSAPLQQAPTPFPVGPDAPARSGSSAGGPAAQWIAGAAVMLTTGLGVESVFSGALFLGLNDLAPWLASLRLAAGGTAVGERSASWGVIRTQLVYAGIEGCPVRLPRSNSLMVLACVGVDVGRLRIDGEVTEPGGTSRSDRKVWVDVPLSIRAEYLPAEPFTLELRAALLVPLTRYDLELIDPPTLEYSMPHVATMVGVGAGVRFP
jgi:hypothetical protein